jgi:hypothetical protein
VVGSPKPNPASSNVGLFAAVNVGAVMLADWAPFTSLAAATSSGVVVSAPTTATVNAAKRPDVRATVGLPSPPCSTRRYSTMCDEVLDDALNDAITAVQPVGVVPNPPPDARDVQNR